jgi:hypothetical protein
MTDRDYPRIVLRRGEEGKFTGDFECSDCKAVFYPHPGDQSALVEEFNAHLRLFHPPEFSCH